MKLDTTDSKPEESIADSLPVSFFDSGAPPRTVIRFEKPTSAIWDLISSIPIIIFCVFAIMHATFWPLIVCIPILAFIIWKFIKLLNREPQIIFSNEGLETKETPFHKWESIDNEEVYRLAADDRFRLKTFPPRPAGNSWYLFYRHPGGTTNIPLRNMELDHLQVRMLLLIYRARHREMSTQQ